MQCKVEICGVNTADLKVLKNDETRALLIRAKAGDASAREELIAGNLRLVLSVIQRFAGRGENVDDLFQVGCVGLIKAVDNFDITQQVKFSTYGVPMSCPRGNSASRHRTRQEIPPRRYIARFARKKYRGLQQGDRDVFYRSQI